MSDHGRIIPLSHEPYEDERFEEAGWPDSLIRLSLEEKRRQAAALQKKKQEKSAGLKADATSARRG
jgi:hypothetical protein